MNNDFQDSLKLKQFVKNSLYRGMNTMLEFLKTIMIKDTVKR